MRQQEDRDHRLLVVMSIQTVRLQTEYRRALATSAATAINIGRVNALIYAIVMESRRIYMSTDPGTVKRYADELIRRNRELAGVIAEWEKTADSSDEPRFPEFKRRILQFIDFRNELVRRATQISPASGRAWGDNDANRSLRTAFNVILVRRSVIAPLSDISRATDSIAAGKTTHPALHVREQGRRKAARAATCADHRQVGARAISGGNRRGDRAPRQGVLGGTRGRRRPHSNREHAQQRPTYRRGATPPHARSS